MVLASFNLNVTFMQVNKGKRMKKQRTGDRASPNFQFHSNIKSQLTGLATRCRDNRGDSKVAFEK
jgi:hypothetical protein